MGVCRTSRFFLLLCLICALSLASNMIHLARADYTTAQTIYIKADGSISPSGAPITSSDNVTYNLTDNINDPSFVGTVIQIQRSNVVFDGQGHTITGPGGAGASYGVVFDVNNVTVENTTIRAFYIGIVGQVDQWATSINWTRIVGNDINSSYGVWLYGMSFFDNVSWNNITAQNPGSYYGIYFYGDFSYGNPCSGFISNNNVSDFAYGIWLHGQNAGGPCFNNTISENNITKPNGYYGIALSNAPFSSVLGNNVTLVGDGSGDGILLEEGSAGAGNGCHNTTIVGNTVRAGYYTIEVEHSHNITISGNTLYQVTNHDTGTLRIFQCSNLTVTGNSMQAINTGIGAWGMNNSSFWGNSITQYGSGGIMLFYASSSNEIFQNTLKSTSSVGLGLYFDGDCSLNYVHDNTIRNCAFFGFSIAGNYTRFINNAVLNCSGSNYIQGYFNVLSQNTISQGGGDGVIVQGPTFNNVTDNNINAMPTPVYSGITLDGASNATVSGNNIGGNWIGLVIISDATNNTLTDNNVTGNQYGIRVESASGNTIYHNDFISNVQQVSQDSSDASVNTWDNGYPSGGNYWSDYGGSDLYSGPNQNIAGADGIGDTPYDTSYGMVGTNKDNYPFMTIFFNQTGIGSDFTGPILNVDGIDYHAPVSFMWGPGSTHTFEFYSPLEVSATGTRYVWDNTTGLSSLRSDSSLTVPFYGSITGNYKTQYLLTVVTDPSGLSPQPDRNPAGEAGPMNGWWYDTGTTVELTAQSVTGRTFNYWDVDTIPQSSGVNHITVGIDGSHTATAHYVPALVIFEPAPILTTLALFGALAIFSIKRGKAT